jgi:hypothetical protein
MSYLRDAFLVLFALLYVAAGFVIVGASLALPVVLVWYLVTR